MKLPQQDARYLPYIEYLSDATSREVFDLTWNQKLSCQGLQWESNIFRNIISNEAASDQLDEPNQPDSFYEDEPIHSVEIAKSITDSDLQTKQHNNDQDIQHNSYSAAVVDTEKEEKKEILVSLGNFGVEYLKAKQLIEKHGHERVAEVIKHAKDQNCKNVAGYVIRALEEKWTFWSKPIKDDYAYGNGEAYITGKYAAFINH